MKRFFVCLLILMLALSGAALAEEGTLTIAMVPKSLDNPIFDDARVAAEEAAARLGVELIWTAPETTVLAEQIALVDALIAQGVDGLLISCIEPTALSEALDRAAAAGIAVACFDADAPDSARAFYVGTDNAALGREAAAQMAALLPEGGNIAILDGAIGAKNVGERIAAFAANVNTGAGWNPCPVLPCHDDIDTAVSLVNGFSTDNPALDAWFFAGGWPLNASADQLADLAAFTARGGIVVSIDAVPAMRENLRQGLAQVLIGQNYTQMGQVGIETLVGVIRGEAAALETIAQSGAVLSTGFEIYTQGE